MVNGLSPLGLLQGGVFSVLLVAASVSDIRRREIPDSFCVLLAFAGLICFSPAKLFGVLAALPLLLAALCKPDRMGGGDVKLTAAAGISLGFWGGTTGLAIGLASLLLFYAISRICGRYKTGGATALPLAPFLSAGFIAAYFLI